MHPSEPLVALNWPEGQALQAPALAAEYLPAAQRVQAVETVEPVELV